MAQKAKIMEKSFRKTLKVALNQIKDMMNAEGITSKQKLYLYNYLDKINNNENTSNTENSFKLEYNPIAMNETSEINKDNVEGNVTIKKRSKNKTNEPISNIKVKNVWGQKDFSHVLQEKNDKIEQLEKELEQYKAENGNLQNDRKKYKSDFDLVSKMEKCLQEKNIKINDMDFEIEQMKVKISSMEMQHSIDNEAFEVTKTANKKLIELSAQQKQVPSTPASYEIESLIKEDKCVLDNDKMQLQNTIDIVYEEIEMYKSKVQNLEKIISDYNTKFNNHRLPINIPDNTGDMEAVLIDELNNITKAYDNIMETNLSLEKQISSDKLKICELNSENLILKSKIKAYEDSKAFIESEKRKLNSMKDDFQNEIRTLQSKIFNHDKLIAEKDKKLLEYRMHMTNLQSNAKSMANELGKLKNGYRNLQDELLAVRNAKNQIELNHTDYKRLCEIYRGFFTDENSAIETIERYRRILSCSLCDLNVKDVVLTKCMHTFCESCVNDRFKSRQRKCPNCQTEFAMNDVKKLFF